ncbi:MAG: hypothetical protein JST54_12855 [Deltaproteobacteria bacterium]|nr:hypothetical protein [Deltaproteobacteria bacterium]
MRRRRTAPAAEGEGFLASISDLMAALLFVFIATVLVFANRLRAAEARAREQEQRARQTNEQLEKERAKFDAEHRGVADARRDLVALLFRNLQAKGLLGLEKTLDTDAAEQGVLHLPEGAVSFSRGKYDFDGAQSVSNLAAVAQELANVLPCYAVSPRPTGDCPASSKTYKLEAMLFEGHTDSHPFMVNGTDLNLYLSTERAIQTYKTVIHRQPVLDDLRNANHQKVLSVAGYGAERLLDSGTGPDADRNNRRIDLRFILTAMASADPTPKVTGP